MLKIDFRICTCYVLEYEIAGHSLSIGFLLSELYLPHYTVNFREHKIKFNNTVKYNVIMEKSSKPTESYRPAQYKRTSLVSMDARSGGC